MSTVTSSTPSVIPFAAPSWMQRHPLASYIFLAFSGTWLLFLPAVLSKGLGLFTMDTTLMMILLMAGVFIGPLAAALIVTGVTEGKASLKIFLRRFVQFRVGLGWYLLVILGYPLVYLVGLAPLVGIGAYTGAGQNLPAIFTAYLPALVMSVIFPALGEEPGWRGFALSRMQQRWGPLQGTFLLARLHALWHLPIYFIPGFTQLDSSTPLSILGQSGAIIAASFVWTWLYNHGKQSIFFAMLIHAASNASPSLVVAMLGNFRPDPWYQTLMFGVIALFLIVLTRGKLGYRTEAAQKPEEK